MPAYVDTFNHLLGIGTIVMQLAVIVLFINFLFFRSTTNKTLRFFKTYGLVLGFLIALSSMALSLFYSEVIGFTACELCWVQRFFIYPQVLILGIALLRSKKLLINLSILFSFLGMLVSIYHVYIENGGSSSLSCAGGGVGVVSCAARYVYEFGYITIPVMALTAQIFILLFGLNYRYFSSKETKPYTS